MVVLQLPADLVFAALAGTLLVCVCRPGDPGFRQTLTDICYNA